MNHSPLPASSYIDPGAFEVDKHKIFYRSWQCVGHISELSTTGAYLTFKVVDEDILVVRGHDDQILSLIHI